MTEIFYEYRYPKGQTDLSWRLDPIDQVPYVELNGQRVYNDAGAVRIYPDGRREAVNGQSTLPPVATLPEPPEKTADPEPEPEEPEVVNATEPEQ